MEFLTDQIYTVATYVIFVLLSVTMLTYVRVKSIVAGSKRTPDRMLGLVVFAYVPILTLTQAAQITKSLDTGTASTVEYIFWIMSIVFIIGVIIAAHRITPEQSFLHFMRAYNTHTPFWVIPGGFEVKPFPTSVHAEVAGDHASGTTNESLYLFWGRKLVNDDTFQHGERFDMRHIREMAEDKIHDLVEKCSTSLNGTVGDKGVLEVIVETLWRDDIQVEGYQVRPLLFDAQGTDFPVWTLVDTIAGEPEAAKPARYTQQLWWQFKKLFK